MTLPAQPVPVIVDASFAIEVLDGAAEYRDAWAGWLEADRMVLVPAHFWCEVGNALLLGLRLSAYDASARLERLAAAGAEVADRGPDGVRDAVGLAERHRLTVYDALYLQLALDVDGDLATLDRSLAGVSRTLGVTTIEAPAG